MPTIPQARTENLKAFRFAGLTRDFKFRDDEEEPLSRNLRNEAASQKRLPWGWVGREGVLHNGYSSNPQVRIGRERDS